VSFDPSALVAPLVAARAEPALRVPDDARDRAHEHEKKANRTAVLLRTRSVPASAAALCDEIAHALGTLALLGIDFEPAFREVVRAAAEGGDIDLDVLIGVVATDHDAREVFHL
jgi:hypothetical protein